MEPPPAVPARTLGWHALDWCSRHLVDLDGDPWTFTPEQARFVLQWYALAPDGRWQYRRGVLRRMKGWGKDPLAAALACFEWLGPCRWGGWDGAGHPRAIREPAAWIQVAAASAAQAEQNTMTLFPLLLPDWLIEQERLRLGIEVCWAPGRRRIQAVSNSSRGLEGARPTLVVEGETQHWISANGGRRLAEVMRSNLAKSPRGRGRALAITNAHAAGEGSVAETDWESRHAPDILYDSREAPPGLDPDSDADVVTGMRAARGDSHWVDLDRLLAEWRDPASDQALSERFFWNRIVAGAGRWLAPSTWAAAERPGDPPADGRRVTLGFDGSVRRDATALVGTDLETGWQWLVGIWERDWDDVAWEVPIAAVHALVRECAERWQVTRMYADPAWWEESVSRWQAELVRPDGDPVVAAWYTGGGAVTRMARAVRAYAQAVEDGSCTHARDPVLTRHVLAAHREPLRGRAGEDGLHLIRKASRASIESMDAAMAAVLSWQACLDSRAQGDLQAPDPVPLRLHLPPETW